MKTAPTALLAASLLANAALLAFVLRPHDSASRPASTVDDASSRSSSDHADTRRLAALQAALASGDPAALQAAGLSAATLRELAAGRALVRAAERIQSARNHQPADDRWWHTGRHNLAASRELRLQHGRELSEALAVVGLGDLKIAFASDQSQQLAFLPPEKRDALRRITQDYDEMMAKFSAMGLQLPSDRERLKLLREERERDIAALLTPAEREAYELRTSPSAQNVRARYGDGIETEEDFRKLYALQKAFDEQYPLDRSAGPIDRDALRQRAEAQRQLQADIRAALGEEKFAALSRAADSDLRLVDSLVSRLDLPSQTTDRIAATRESLAAASQRINADTTLTPQQRREQLQNLGARAKADLAQTLGAEAATAYANASPWISMLQNGMAYTTTPPAHLSGLSPVGPSIHPVPPPGAPAQAGAQRTFTIASPVAADGPIAHDIVGPGPGVRVMTFSTDAAAPAPATTTRPAPGPAEPKK